MITIKALIEIIGFPENHVNESVEKVMEMLSKESIMKIVKKDIEKAKKVKELWSSIIEVEIDLDDLTALNKFCFDYLPTSIEIQDVKELKFETKEINYYLNDLLAKIHQYNNVIRNLHAETTVLKQKLEKSSYK